MGATPSPIMPENRDVPLRLAPSRLEYWIMVSIGLFAVTVLSIYFIRTCEVRHLDSSALYEAAISVIETGKPTTATAATVPPAILNFSLPAVEVCQLPLSADVPPYNVLHNHAYLGIFPIGLLSWLVTPEAAFAILTAAAYVLMVLIPFYYLRRWGVGYFAAITFGIVVVLYPAISYSATGDYYMDRFAMPALLLLALSLHGIVRNRGVQSTSKGQLLVVIFSAAASVLCSERAAIMALGTLFFFGLFFPSIRRERIAWGTLLVLAITIILYLAWYFSYVYVGFKGGGSLIGNAIPVWKRQSVPQLRPFLLVNLLFMAPFVVFSGFRYSLLAIGAMFPNVIITIGGAELNGWTTHYHAMYIPFLIAAATIGFASVAGFPMASWLRQFFIPTIGLCIAIVLATTLEPFTGQFSGSTWQYIRQGILGRVWIYYCDPALSGERVMSVALKELVSVIPSGSKVSCIEGAMPALYRGRSLSLFPLGIDTADYLVVSGSVSDKGEITWACSLSYLSTEENTAQNRGLFERAKKNGFVLAQHFHSIGTMVMRRTPGNDKIQDP